MPYNMYYDHSGPGGWWILGVLAMVIFWGGIIVLILAAIRHYGGHRHDGPTARDWTAPRAGSPSEAPVEALKMRFAQGEIDEDEFTRRLQLLQSPK